MGWKPNFNTNKVWGWLPRWTTRMIFMQLRLYVLKLSCICEFGRSWMKRTTLQWTWRLKRFTAVKSTEYGWHLCLHPTEHRINEWHFLPPPLSSHFVPTILENGPYCKSYIRIRMNQWSHSTSRWVLHLNPFNTDVVDRFDFGGCCRADRWRQRFVALPSCSGHSLQDTHLGLPKDKCCTWGLEGLHPSKSIR